MKPQPCESLEPLLVDYADGILEPVQSQRVAEHVATCQSCRATLDALRQSLSLAQVVWEDNLPSQPQTAWANPS